MLGMKLFAFKPGCHGPKSFFVCAENLQDAKIAVKNEMFTVENGRRIWDDYDTQRDCVDAYDIEEFDDIEVAYNDND